MMMRKLIKILSIWVLLPIAALAHDPDQISYHFTQKEGAGTLSIRFTPKSALDLLLSLHDELDAKNAIRLADYHDDFTAYFNKTISLKVKEEAVNLMFHEASFKGHDASITFKLSSFSDSFEEVDLGITSFTEIYRRTNNHVYISGHEPVVLDREIQHYHSVALPERQGNISTKGGSQIIMLLIIAAALIVAAKYFYLTKVNKAAA